MLLRNLWPRYASSYRTNKVSLVPEIIKICHLVDISNGYMHVFNSLHAASLLKTEQVGLNEQLLLTHLGFGEQWFSCSTSSGTILTAYCVSENCDWGMGIHISKLDYRYCKSV